MRGNTKETKEFTLTIRYHDDNTVTDKEIIVSEEVYRAYKRPEWAEKKRAERESRCIITTSNGVRVRCMEDCEKCARMRSGMPLSLDLLSENGEEPLDDKLSFDDIILKKELSNALHAAIDSLNEKQKKIVLAIMTDKDDRTAATELGYKAQSSYSYQKLKVLKQLRELLKDYL